MIAAKCRKVLLFLIFSMSSDVKTKNLKVVEDHRTPVVLHITSDPLKEYQLIVYSTYMDIEPGPPSCPFDYIEVYDGLNMTQADATRMCGIDLPGPVYSETNYIKVFQLKRHHKL